MKGLHAAVVLVQWAAGMEAFMWVTGRRREVGIGYGWTVRLSALALTGLAAWTAGGRHIAALIGIGALAAVLVAGSAESWIRRRAGVAGQRSQVQGRSQRVAEMTGIDTETKTFSDGPEFRPGWDAAAALVGFVAVVVTTLALKDGGGGWLAIARNLVGAAFLGAVTDSMLLGHWYLVQPGLPRAPLLELVRWVGWLTPVEVALLLVPTGMISVLNGSIDDGYGGMLGWFWLASAVTTGGLVVVTRAALKERQYAAVMAATGLLYLAILTAFCTDLVARALLQ